MKISRNMNPLTNTFSIFRYAPSWWKNSDVPHYVTWLCVQTFMQYVCFT